MPRPRKADGEPFDPKTFIPVALTMITPLAEKLLGETQEATQLEHVEPQSA